MCGEEVGYMQRTQGQSPQEQHHMQHSAALTSSWGTKMVPEYVPAVLLLAAVAWNASFTPSHSELSSHRSMSALKFCRAGEQVAGPRA